MLILIAAAMLLQVPDEPMEGLVARLGDPALKVREEAQAELQARWKRTDLTPLRKAMEHPDPEVAARVRLVVNHTESRRRFPDFPEELWRARPDVESRLQQNDAHLLGDMLWELLEACKEGELSARHVVPAAILLADDGRETAIGTGCWSGGREWMYDVCDLAYQVIWQVAPALTTVRSAEARLEWWRRNRGLPDRQVHLSALGHGEAAIRAESIRRLAELGDSTLYPRLFEVLHGIEDAAACLVALSGLSALPADELLPHLWKVAVQGPLKRRIAGIQAAADVRDTGAEALLLSAFDDPETEYGTTRFGGTVSIGNARVCDLAGICLSERMGIEREFTWPDSIRTRNANLQEIRNRWRGAKGLPPLPFHGPGATPVSTGRIEALLHALEHESQEWRVAAGKQLATLGNGGWEPLRARIETAPEPIRSRLIDAAKSWSNTVRRVESDVAAAAPLVARLNKLLERPFNADMFIDAVVQTWCRTDGPDLLVISVTRHGDGAGISIKVSEWQEAKPTDAPPLLSYGSPGRGTFVGMSFGHVRLHEEMETDLAKLKEAMDQVADRQLQLDWRLRRIDSTSDQR